MPEREETIDLKLVYVDMMVMTEQWAGAARCLYTLEPHPDTHSRTTIHLELECGRWRVGDRIDKLTITAFRLP